MSFKVAPDLAIELGKEGGEDVISNKAWST
jgi:hypothetical protein